ncbi:sensor histidine kinase [Variovorax atrisoli]|uniref:sensor histidine kinase n=1 Tax=Variovorax atrisoli TaxID=3394203 RepID=UPI00160F7A8E|nr:sensor histidine kinase [Variovorax sp. BK613]MBB3639117.1 signal transduction histidine kinase [Variovorax sp. BK613]
MKRNRCLFFILGVALWLVSLVSHALELRSDQGLEEPVLLHGHEEIFIDTSGNISIEDILSGREGVEFIAGDTRHGRLRPGEIYWIRFSLQREPGAPSQWAVQIFPNWIDDVEVYRRDASGKISVDRVGDQHPFVERTIRSGMLAFPVEAGSSPETYYVRVRTHGLAPLCLHVWQRAGMERVEISRMVLVSALAGAFGVMVLMNLIFWVWLRNGIYAVYALFLAFMFVFVALMQGYANSLLFPEAPVVADRFMDVISSALMSIGAVFAWRFFDYDSYSPWAAWLMKAAAATFAATAFLSAWGVQAAVHVAIYLQMGVGVFNLGFFVWLMLRHRAFHYLLATTIFTCVNLSWTFYVLVLLGVVNMSQPYLLDSWIPMLQLANLAMLNFAVASRSRQAELALRAERKVAFDSMKVAKKALEDRVRQREFVAVVSHEFRTPLAIVDAVAHALELSPSGRDEAVKRAVGKIRKAIRRLAVLIENILQDDALAVGSTKPAARSFDLREVIESVAGVGLPEENARLSVEAPTQRTMCMGDPAKIEMAIRNLVHNALKYSPSNSTVTVRCDSMTGFFSVTVCNQGEPIPDGEQSSLFERYFRGATSTQVPGSGLGLHISRTIARQHGGDVVLLSSDDQGTVFRLTIPLEPAPLGLPR